MTPTKNQHLTTTTDAPADALIAAVVAAMREHAGPLRQTFDQAGAIAYVGVSRSAWFRLRAADELPAPVAIPGCGPRWRRADLDRWLAKLKPAKRKARTAEPCPTDTPVGVAP